MMLIIPRNITHCYRSQLPKSSDILLLTMLELAKGAIGIVSGIVKEL